MPETTHITERDQTAYLTKMAWSLGIVADDIPDAIQEALIGIWRSPSGDWRFVARNRMIDLARKLYGRKGNGRHRDHFGEKRNHLPIEDALDTVEAPDRYEAVEVRMTLDSLLRCPRLTVRERLVLDTLRADGTLVELEPIFGVSQTRVSQLRNSAFAKLREHAGDMLEAV